MASAGSTSGANAPLLEVRNLCKAYVQKRPLSSKRFTVDALNSVSLKLPPGKTLAVVGESGSGKSTLARCIALLETPTAGEIIFEGRNLLDLNPRELSSIRRSIQLIFQDPASALNPGMTAGDLIAEPLLIQRIGNPDERSRKVLEMMERVGLPAEGQNKLPLEFSGGQRQRIAIARALVLEPKLLILDEALSSLDIANQESILELLAELQRACALTYIHVSHDLRIVSGCADEIAVMHAGRIVEHKSAAELLASPQHTRTQALLAARRSTAAIRAERAPKVPA